MVELTPDNASDSASLLPADHPVERVRRIGVLVVNLGTPEATDYWSMRRYLKEFLSDRRVIEAPRLLWWLVLNLIILTKRPGPKGRDYDSIWNKERNEGPLKTITRAQTERLSQAFKAEECNHVVVDWAMRYGQPTIESGLKRLQSQNCDRILLMPLYPQYAAATTATVCDKAFEALMRMRWQPSLRVLPPYYDEYAYIQALCQSMRQSLSTLAFEPEVVLISFHGMPRSYLEKGDPYYCQCAKSWRLLHQAMGWTAQSMPMSFQSRFGREEWLTPYTDETVKALALKGVKRLAVLTPGFSADCLETLEEIGVENAEIFHHNGGEHFAALPCLNDSPDGVSLLKQLAAKQLQGWL